MSLGSPERIMTPECSKWLAQRNWLCGTSGYEKEFEVLGLGVGGVTSHCHVSITLAGNSPPRSWKERRRSLFDSCDK